MSFKTHIATQRMYEARDAKPLWVQVHERTLCGDPGFKKSSFSFNGLGSAANILLSYLCIKRAEYKGGDSLEQQIAEAVWFNIGRLQKQEPTCEACLLLAFGNPEKVPVLIEKRW